LEWSVVRRLKPEERVNLAIGMSDVCIRVCADGVRDQNPGISEEELIERVRERLEWSKRYQKRKRYRQLCKFSKKE
jgi:uncharacterized tellurite resistance protein B-like protein